MHPRQNAAVMPTLTAGIRGTGVYAEVFPSQGNRSYFCNCYGTVDMESNGEKVVSQSNYHQAFWGEVAPRDGRQLTPANAINHSDEELEFLAGLVNQQTAWQIARICASLNVPSKADPRWPEVPKATRCAGFAGSGVWVK